MKPELEDRIRRAWDARELDAAATEAIRGYGPEILGFLIAMLRDEDAAREVFSAFCEDLWSGLPRFEWRSSFRTWAYALAHHAADRHRHRAPRAHVPLDEVLSGLAERLWRSTRAERRSRARDRIAALRDSLDPEDRALLILRVDRALAWDEIVVAMQPPGEPLGPDAQRRRAAALRKRFERVKDDLRTRAIAEGLLPAPGSNRGRS